MSLPGAQSVSGFAKAHTESANLVVFVSSKLGLFDGENRRQDGLCLCRVRMLPFAFLGWWKINKLIAAELFQAGKIFFSRNWVREAFFFLWAESGKGNWHNLIVERVVDLVGNKYTDKGKQSVMDREKSGVWFRKKVSTFEPNCFCRFAIWDEM